MIINKGCSGNTATLKIKTMKAPKPVTEKHLFDFMIQKKPPISFISGKPLTQFLNSNLRYNCCAHVIPKRGHLRLNFPSKNSREQLLRLNEDNIVLITPIEHFLIDQGTRDQRQQYEKENNCSFDVFYNLKEELIRKLQKQLKH